jgi:glutamine synthetase
MTADVRDHVLKQIKENGIEDIRIVVLDLHGVPRGKVVNAKRFEHVLTNGHPWALPLLAVDLWESRPPEETEFGADIGYRNGVMMPDPSTFRRLPWTRSTAHVFADVLTNDGKATPSPRQVLRRVLARAEAAGYVPVFGSELEFYVYKPELGDHGFDAVFGRQSWFSINALGLTQHFVDAVTDTARAMELPLWDICNEYGAGQFEINLEPATGLSAIDNLVALKIAIKEIAVGLGLRATFVAKPTNLWETPPSGYHLHQTLNDKDGANAFLDPSSEHHISDLCRHYVGGQLRHARAMTAVAAPTVTAYKRYVPGTVAPVSVVWAIDNRSAPIRVLPSGPSTHLENRLGSSDANPYLLAAVNLAAGLDGIANKSDPGQPGSGNLFEDKRHPPLPSILIEAVEAFEEDAELVEALGPDFARIYTRVLHSEWKRYIGHVSDWEIREYRDIL